MGVATPARAQRRVRLIMVAPLSWDLKSVRPEALRHRLSTALPFSESASSVLSLRVLVYRGVWVNPHHLSNEAALGTMLNHDPWVSPRVLLHTVRADRAGTFPKKMSCMSHQRE